MFVLRWSISLEASKKIFGITNKEFKKALEGRGEGSQKPMSGRDVYLALRSDKGEA